MNAIDTALQIAIKAHFGQLDKTGESYILHPLAVGLMGNTDEERAAGFLHDVIEDSDYTAERMLEEGIPDGIVNAVEILTHKSDIPYIEYIQNIIDSKNPIALQVKYNDLQHNYSRSKDYPELQKKYKDALDIVKPVVEERSKVSLYTESGNSYAIFACGCFWGVQHLFNRTKGVIKTIVGYTGGSELHPSYADVRNHKTHHVEAVLVEYNPTIISYIDLCKLFFEMHDPAQTDGVGPDMGPQYRSCIFLNDEKMKTEAESVIDILRNKGYEVNTLLLPRTSFWIAEEYHQHYYEITGGSPYCHVRERKF